MKTYTLCGSMRFEKEMRKIAFLLEAEKGYNILQCVYTDTHPTSEELERIKAAHFRKIDISDGIYVLNIGGYIGQSVFEEIAYANKQGKEILYHCSEN